MTAARDDRRRDTQLQSTNSAPTQKLIEPENRRHRLRLQTLRAMRALPIILILSPVLLRADAPTNTIRADAIHADIAYLASDELAGRGSGTKGNEAAARYITAAF